MCNCRKYADGWRAGVERGVMEVHSPDFCRTHRIARWYTRILYAVGAFFSRLAGRDAEQAMTAYYEWHRLWNQSSIHRKRQTGSRMEVLSAAYDKFEETQE